MHGGQAVHVDGDAITQAAVNLAASTYRTSPAAASRSISPTCGRESPADVAPAAAATVDLVGLPPQPL